MEKATKALRRSGVRLRSLSSGHGDLQMVISQLGEVRTSFKAFTLAQATATEDLLRWAGGGGQENRAIEETFTHLAELSVLWSEVQKDFADQLREYRTQYELVLEGERHVAAARELLSVREQREGKLRKDLKRASKKAPVEEVCMLKEKLGQAERSRDLAHLDVVERVGENEAVKMIRVKEGLLKLGAAYCELAQKCLVIFSAHQEVAAHLPDVNERDLQGVKYTGAGAASRSVQQARERIRSFRRNSTSPPKAAPHPSEPPPPYTPHRYPSAPPTHPHPHPPFTHSPSLPEEHTPHPNYSPYATQHSNSAPNLAEEVTPRPAPDTPDTPNTPDTSPSPDMTQPLPPPPPFDPYYDWLPERTETRDEGSIEARNGLGGGGGVNGYISTTTPTTTPTINPHPTAASVRPRVGRNPFLEDSEGEEECGGGGGGGGGGVSGVASLSGALKKTAIR